MSTMLQNGSHKQITGIGAASHVLMTLPNNVQICDESGDDLSLEKAAFRSRMVHDRISNDELKWFPDVKCAYMGTKNVYLFLRNSILQLWLRDCREELTVEKVLTSIAPPYNANTHMIRKIHAYLERRGYINFGVYRFIKTSPRLNRSILVIGAGVAGLIAARQLESFGFEVTVLEARDRVGGRMALFHKPPYLADLGAMVIAGLGGNPVITLAQQIDLKLQTVKNRCPLYDWNGEPLLRQKDELMEKEFNRLLDACAYLAHTSDIDTQFGRHFSLGECFDHVMTLQERHTKDKQLSHWKILCELQERLMSMYHKLNRKRVEIASLHEQYKRALEEEAPLDPKENAAHDFQVRFKRYELDDACRTYDEIRKAIESLEESVKAQEEEQPGDSYISNSDRRIIDWYCANLEFANAAPLHKLSLKYWDQDDVNELPGDHLTVKNGYGTLPIALAEGLNIKFQVAVKNVLITSGDVEVTYEDLKSNELQRMTTITADAVLCTLPLGVLKESLTDPPTTNGAENKNVINFQPRLPQKKIDAVNRLGFGILNKVVLCFDRIFWDPTLHTFGHIDGTSSESRGEFYIFWTIYAEPIIVTLIVGDAAVVMENMDDDAVVERCLIVLRAIFKDEIIQPKESIVTKWGKDPWSRGSYSYVAVGANGHEYDLLADPVAYTEDEPENLRLFFAGEHTCRQYPATVHGAFLSGLREASRIADTFVGPLSFLR